MNDDWKDNVAGALVAAALMFILIFAGLFLIYLARSTQWL